MREHIPGPMDHKRPEHVPHPEYSPRPEPKPLQGMRCRRRHPILRTQCVRPGGHEMNTCWDAEARGWPTQADMGFLRGKKGEDGELLGNRRERRNAGRLKIMKRRKK